MDRRGVTSAITATIALTALAVSLSEFWLDRFRVNENVSLNILEFSHADSDSSTTALVGSFALANNGNRPAVLREVSMVSFVDPQRGSRPLPGCLQIPVTLRPGDVVPLNLQFASDLDAVLAPTGTAGTPIGLELHIEVLDSRGRSYPITEPVGYCYRDGAALVTGILGTLPRRVVLLPRIRGPERSGRFIVTISRPKGGVTLIPDKTGGPPRFRWWSEEETRARTLEMKEQSNQSPHPDSAFLNR